jgi:hypothetical protein
MSAEAPIHEFTHLWERLMPEDWKKGLEFFKKSSGFAKALKEIQDNPAYKDLTQEQKESEAMNTILGRMGEGYFSSDMLTKFKNWFTQLLKKVADKLNLRKLTPNEKFESFANKVLGDLFGGKDITEKQEGKKGDLQLMKIGGKEVQVRRLPEQLDVVNGFYSPLEKMLLETKFDKLPAKQWIEKFGKSEEAKWTGLSDWLSQQQGSVSKADIQQYLKDNRIQVVEVVKGEKGQKMMSKSEARKVFEDNGYDVVTDKNGDTYVEKNEEIFDYNDMSELEKSAFDALTINNSDRVSVASDTKYYKYQLEGEKQNYKEILVTLPSKDINAVSNYNVIVNEEKAFLDKISSMPTDEQRTIYNDIKKRKADAEKLLPKDSFIGNHGLANTNAKEFKSTHFEEPNILVHLRMNTRKDSQGNKVLFLEEIQGDFPQEYRKQQNLINDYVDKNSAKVIEEFKKKGILEVICP